MNRRTVLAGMGTAAAFLAGCVDDGGDPETSTGGSNTSGSNGNSETADHWDVGERPQCELEPETVEVIRGGDHEQAESVGTIPYPAVPEEFTKETAGEFVEDHEAAFIRHRYLCSRDHPERTLRFSYSVVDRWVFEREDGFRIPLLYVGGATEGVDSDGHVWVTDLGYSGAVYEIAAAGVARADFDELPTLDGMPDPDDGTLESAMPDPVERGEYVIEF